MINVYKHVKVIYSANKMSLSKYILYVNHSLHLQPCDRSNCSQGLSVLSLHVLYFL